MFTVNGTKKELQGVFFCERISGTEWICDQSDRSRVK